MGARAAVLWTKMRSLTLSAGTKGFVASSQTSAQASKTDETQKNAAPLEGDEHGPQRAAQKTCHVAVVGVPNVGKSTFSNAVIGTKVGLFMDNKALPLLPLF